MDRLFRPRAVAIVGASASAGKVTARPLLSLLRHGYAGAISNLAKGSSLFRAFGEGWKDYALQARPYRCWPLLPTIARLHHTPTDVRACESMGRPEQSSPFHGFPVGVVQGCTPSCRTPMPNDVMHDALWHLNPRGLSTRTRTAVLH